jgi:hypothetical protein
MWIRIQAPDVRALAFAATMGKNFHRKNSKQQMSISDFPMYGTEESGT